jgi:two-component system cell cycle sensor histidine kinase/response regulator CckA
MGPFLLLNTSLIGFFGFAAVYHFILWVSSRRETLLAVFSVDCALRAISCGVAMGLAMSATVAEAQAILYGRIAFGLLILLTWLWCVALIAEVQVPWFMWPVTVGILLVFLLHLFVVPLNATVISVSEFRLFWGEAISNPKLGLPGWWIGPLSLVAISIEIFAIYCGSRLWSRDRMAAGLIFLAAGALMMLHITDVLRARGLLEVPFIGVIGQVIWAGMIGLVIARRNSRMRQAIIASEQRFRGIFDQTLQFIGLIGTDGRVIEANRTALEFAGIQAEDVIGKLFWETPWWSHSPELQDRLRQAVRDAAAGHMVRFEAEHPRPDGGVAYVDFSLKPLLNERGDVSLLIPEGRDITERRLSEDALQRRVTELTILSQIGVICSEASSADVVLERVTPVIAGIGFSHNCGFSMLDPLRNILVRHPSFIMSDPTVGRPDKLLGATITGEVAITGTSRRVRDVAKEPGYATAESRTRSKLCLPMRIGTNVVGVLNVESEDLDAFTAADEQLLSTVVDIVGNAVERLRAQEKIRENQQFLSTVSQAFPNWIYIFDFDATGIVYSNRSILRDLGYPSNEPTDQGPLETFAAHMPQEEMPHLARLLEEWKRLPDGELRDDKYYLCHADGTIHSFEGREIVFARRADGSVRQVLGALSDITTRDQAEKSLRQSEQRFAQFMLHLPGLAWIKDANGRYVYANDAAVKVFRMSREQFYGKTDDEVFPPETAAQFKESDRQALISESGMQAIESLEFDDGLIHHVIASKFALPFSNGQPTTVGGIAIDITERRRAEETLRESEERFRALVEHGFEGINIVDSQGTLIYAGPGNKSVLGYSAEEVKGRSTFETIHPDDLPKAHTAWHQILQNPEQIFQPALRLRHKDGSWHWMEVSACNLLHHPAVGGIVVNWRDITQRKLAEDKLQESEERKAAIFESALDALITIDQEGKVVEWNPAAERIFGYTSQQAIGREMAELVIPPQSREAHRQGMEEFRGTGEGTVLRKLVELTALRADGTAFPAEIYITPIRTQSPSFSGFIRDITDRKLAEEERRKLEAQILHGQKLESLGVLAGGIAHDFNNLLTVMLGNASLALMHTSEESPACSMLREIEHAAERAADLTKQMLAYSGKGKFEIQALRLDALVQEMATLLKTVVSKKATIVLDLAAATVEGDPTQIRQVVMNLIINASDALEDNVGSIQIRTGTVQANTDDLLSPYLPEMLPAGVYAYLEIEDAGQGMTKETQARIFDPFFTTKFTGRGLGLAAVLGIVRAHRGTIKVASTPGQGTLFKLLFPCAVNVPQERSDIESEMVSRPGHGTVLVIDDERIINVFVERALASAGYQVLAAEDGLEGLKMLREYSQEIVAILLDLTMPRMDGLEVMRELRHLAPDIPVLVMSGYSEQEVSIRCEGTGVRGFIKKPFTTQALVTAISGILTTSNPTPDTN